MPSSNQHYLRQAQAALAEGRFKDAHRCARSVDSDGELGSEATRVLGLAQYQLALGAFRRDVSGDAMQYGQVLGLLGRAARNLQGGERETVVNVIDQASRDYIERCYGGFVQQNSYDPATRLLALVVLFCGDAGLKGWAAAELSRWLLREAQTRDRRAGDLRREFVDECKRRSGSWQGC